MLLRSRVTDPTLPLFLDFSRLQFAVIFKRLTLATNMSPSNNHHARNREDPGSPTETHALLPSFLPQTIHPDGESGRRGFNPKHFFKVLWRSSNQVSMTVNLLWPFCFLAIIMNFVTPHLDIWVFVISYIGMIPAANLLGFAGQEFARKMPKVSGILIETTFVRVPSSLHFSRPMAN